MLLEKTVNQAMVAMVLLGCGDATTLSRNIPARRRSGPRLAFRGCGTSASGRESRSTAAFYSSNYFLFSGTRSRSGRVLWSKAGQGSSSAPLGRACSTGIMKRPLPPEAGAERRRRRWTAPAALGVGAADEISETAIVGERESNGGSPVPLSMAAQAYYDRKREAMRDWTRERQSRDLCARCGRARQTCLCSSLPVEAVPTSTRFIILQHPTESKKRVTGTVPLVLHCLSNCRRVVVRYDYSEDDLRKILGVGAGGVGGSEGSPLLLFPFPGAEYLEDVAASRENAREAALSSSPPQPQSSTPPSPPPSPPPRNATVAPVADETGDTASSPSLLSAQQPPPAALPGPVVVVIDGTWSQAKQILSRYPFLTPERLRAPPTSVAPAAAPTEASGGDSARAHGDGDDRLGNEEEQDGRQGRGGDGVSFRPVKFRSAGVSSYGFRREPAKECLSTLESVAYTLEVLEATPRGVSAAGHLRKAFAAMVAMQVEAADAAGSNPRFVNRKGRTANRRLTPKKDRRRG